MNMKQVTRNEFYKAISTGDVVGEIINDKYPYTYEFRIRNSGRVIGRIVGTVSNGLEENQYYLAKGE